MRVFVVVATKGRPTETGRLMTELARQTVQPARVIVVGTSPDDVAGVTQAAPGLEIETVLASKPGLTRQRNIGIDRLGLLATSDIVAFFDDDFRPARDWLQRAEATFDSDPSVVALSGRVLADGALGEAITELEAELLLSDPAGDAQAVSVADLYGCNMAIRGSLFKVVRFDEQLPLYGWLEDRDMQGRVARYGQLVKELGCIGVHLGVKGGRISGRRFGYSQIANPLHLYRNRTIHGRMAAMLMLRALASNLCRFPVQARHVDYRGRLSGNGIALLDLALRRLHPGGIQRL